VPSYGSADVCHDKYANSYVNMHNFSYSILAKSRNMQT